MNPGLASLDIQLDILEEQSAALLNSLPSKFSLSSTSGSRNLSIEFGRIRFDHPCHPTPLDRWYYLREMELEDADPEAVFYASHLPHLRVLVIERFSTLYHVDRERFASNLLPFPELRHLEIQNIALRLSHQLLPLLRCSKVACLKMLQDLNTPCNLVSREADFTSFVEGVGRHCNPAYLHTLHFTTRAPISLDVGLSILAAPLQRFNLLRSFKMRTGMCPWVSPQDATWIGQNWSNIRTLCINPSDYIERFRRPRSKLSVLSCFAYACYELEHLELEVDAEKFCERSELFKSLVRPDGSPTLNAPTLKKLHVRHSPIKNRDKKLVAAYLNFIFPNLETLDATSHSWNVDDFCNRWDRIAKHILPEMRRNIQAFDMDGVPDIERESSNRRYQYMKDVEVVSDAEEESDQDKCLMHFFANPDLGD
ncbi:hypothetical protein NP233_g10578 [Leucocoprinus birnbaumii]|uniref:Uncharacterized protein n=1 Tax=Leucocoprinus birnbaumii TaxID=56174 RepID=A0AAD5VK36_9AGAR|nr:hypothetical protein NP233_g10578 [Leucocoprinus birnbaumii]